MLDRAYLAEGMPTLIIWGRRDAIIPIGHGRLAQIAMPGSQLEIFDEAGHFPHHTDPARFAKVVQEFVVGTAPARFDKEDWRRRLLRGTRRVAVTDLMEATELTETETTAASGEPAELTLLDPPSSSAQSGH